LRVVEAPGHRDRRQLLVASLPGLPWLRKRQFNMPPLRAWVYVLLWRTTQKPPLRDG
jgi:hypothetical protein